MAPPTCDMVASPLRGPRTGRRVTLNFSCCDCCVQFGGGHRVGCVFFEIIADEGRGCDPSGKTHPAEERHGPPSCCRYQVKSLAKTRHRRCRRQRGEHSDGTLWSCFGDPIPQLHPIVPDGADLVTVEVNRRGALLCIEDHRSVSRLPVGVVLNCCGHLLFDLTHGWVRCFDSYKIPQRRGRSDNRRQFGDRHTGC